MAATAALFVTPVDRAIIVASGGLGLLAELIVVVGARLTGTPTTLIHHSACYVRKPSRLMGALVAAGGPLLRHAALDEVMAWEFASRYRIDRSLVAVVDNAGLMPVAPPGKQPSCRSGAIHLSNLSAEKGLLAVLEVAARTQVPTRLVGAISPVHAEAVASARARGVAIIADGPLFGEAKFDALAAARCFLFLSSYRHEAQPLVIYEAASVGCVPIAWRTGWVGEQMARLSLDEFVFDVGDLQGVVRAVTRIADMDTGQFDDLSDRVRSVFEAHRQICRHQYRAVLANSPV